MLGEQATIEPRLTAAQGPTSKAAIQPCGFLLVLSADWRITCASENLGDFLPVEPSEVLDRPLADLFDSQAVHAIRNRVALLRHEESPERLLELSVVAGGNPLDVVVRLSGRSVILEAVPAMDVGGIDVAATVARMGQRLMAAEASDAIAATAAIELRGLTGFDSVAIYKLSAGAPKCIARSTRNGSLELDEIRLTPSVVRQPLWIADASSHPVGLVCSEQRAAADPTRLLALAGEGLGDVLQSSGAASAVLLPIPCSTGLWGFALALHGSPRAPRLARLSAAELFMQLVGLRIEAGR